MNSNYHDEPNNVSIKKKDNRKEKGECEIGGEKDEENP